MNQKRALITGGTQGLGKALAGQLLALDYRVAVIARHAEGLAELRKLHPEAIALQGDVSRKEDIYPLAIQAIHDLRGLDLLVHNASSLGPPRLKLLADTECEEFENALQTNVLGPFRLTKALLGPLMESRGRIVHIGSDAALHPYSHWGAYGASKAALHHLSRIWETELSTLGIQVLSWDPGDMRTAMHFQALPDADPAGLKDPETSARELIARLEGAAS